MNDVKKRCRGPICPAHDRPGIGVVRAAVLTVSDGVFQGRVRIAAAPARGALEAEGYEVERRVVPDERDEIAGAMRSWPTARSSC